ncbi:uncharacterized protein METZ01_LOCUS497986, partial [marine metagenome]
VKAGLPDSVLQNPRIPLRIQRLATPSNYDRILLAIQSLENQAQIQSFLPEVASALRTDQNTRFSMPIMTTKNKIVIMPPARTKSFTRYPPGPIISAFTW